MAKRASQGKEAHSIAHSVLQHPQVGNRNIDNGNIKISMVFCICIYLNCTSKMFTFVFIYLFKFSIKFTKALSPNCLYQLLRTRLFCAIAGTQYL